MTSNQVKTRIRSTGDGTETVGCAECGSTEVAVDEKRGESVCRGCGLVIDERIIDRGPEWRAFDQDQWADRARIGAPTSRRMHDNGLTTAIDWRDKDAGGRTLSPEKRSRFRRLREWQERIRTKDAGERNLKVALSEIERMASAMGITDAVREFASVLYRRALAADLIRGRSIEGVAAAALYAACRQDGTPRALTEVTAVARVGRTEIGRTYRMLIDDLDLDVPPVDPGIYVPRFCSALDLGSDVRRVATDIVALGTDRGLHSGKSPSGFAAAAVYLGSQLCGESRTQRNVSEVADVTVVTVRNRYQELEELLETVPGAELAGTALEGVVGREVGGS